MEYIFLVNPSNGIANFLTATVEMIFVFSNKIKYSLYFSLKNRYFTSFKFILHELL